MATDSTLIAFFAALAATPPDEAVPPVDASLLTDSDRLLKQLNQDTADLSFWRRYDRLHDLVVAHYNIKKRNKILLANTSPESAENFAKELPTNASLPAKEILPFRLLSAEEILNSPDLQATTYKQFRYFQKIRDNVNDEELHYIEWSYSLFK